MADKVLTSGPAVARLGEWFRLNQRQWGDELGVDRSTVAAYKNTPGKGPSRERLKEIAAAYGVPISWFYEEHPSDPPVPRDIDEAKRLALLANLDASSETTVNNSSEDLGVSASVLAASDIPMPFRGYLPADDGWDEDDSDDFPSIDLPAFLGRKDPGEPERVVMRVKNDSMEPRLFAGDLVVVVEDHTPRAGRLVVARSGKSRTVKVLRRSTPMRYSLESINPQRGEAVAEEWEILGYVVAVLHDYAKGRGNIEWDEGGLTP